MSTASATPGPAAIKIGVLADMIYPPPGHYDTWRDYLDGLQMAIDELTPTLLDRPVQTIVRQVEGLPRGEFDLVRHAWEDLVDDGCLIVHGPIISENAVPLVGYIEQVAAWPVPTITWAGSESWLSDWCFAMNNGSLQEEPWVVANIMAAHGVRRVGLLRDHSLIGVEYTDVFRRAAKRENIEIVREVVVSQVEATKHEPLSTLRSADVDAIVSFGFGYGLWGINDALRELDWDVARYTNTSWELAFFSDEWMRQLEGWIGLEQYDERNVTGQGCLDRFAERYGRRPEYYAPIYGYDVGQAIMHALGGATSLSPRGVRDSLERIKLLPAACGAPGTYISFGRYKRQGWVGAGYLVARQVVPGTQRTTFKGTMGAVEVTAGDAPDR